MRGESTVATDGGGEVTRGSVGAAGRGGSRRRAMALGWRGGRRVAMALRLGAHEADSWLRGEVDRVEGVAGEVVVVVSGRGGRRRHGEAGGGEREMDASESELSGRSGDAERSDDAAVDGAAPCRLGTERRQHSEIESRRKCGD